jgi:hypothetical protein
MRLASTSIPRILPQRAHGWRVVPGEPVVASQPPQRYPGALSYEIAVVGALFEWLRRGFPGMLERAARPPARTDIRSVDMAERSLRGKS